MTFTLDDSLGLERREEGVFAGHTDKRYWNMIGPYGGWVAAMLLKAAIHDQADSAFEPVAITVDFMKAPKEGPVLMRRACDRSGRTASFWRIEMETANGTPCARALLTMAERRDTVVFSPETMPQVPNPDAVERFETTMLPVKWAHLYETRVVKGAMGGITPDTQSLVWVRDADGRPIDHLSMLAISDSPFPRLFLATGRPANISTITMTTYLHASMAELQAIGSDLILADSRCARSVGGFYDQHTHFYSQSGDLVAASQQMVWYDRKPD